MPKRGASTGSADVAKKSATTNELSQVFKPSLSSAQLPTVLLVRCWRNLSGKRLKAVRLVCHRWSEICKLNFPLTIGSALKLKLTSAGRMVELYQGHRKYVYHRFVPRTPPLRLTLQELEALLNRCTMKMDSNLALPNAALLTVLILEMRCNVEKMMNRILEIISQCRGLRFSTIAVTGQVDEVGYSNLLTTLKAQYDLGYLRRILLEDILLKTSKTSKKKRLSVIDVDHRIMLPDLTMLYISPAGGTYRIDQGCFFAYVKLGRSIVLAGKGVNLNSSFVKAAIQAWKAAVTTENLVSDVVEEDDDDSSSSSSDWSDSSSDSSIRITPKKNPSFSTNWRFQLQYAGRYRSAAFTEFEATLSGISSYEKYYGDSYLAYGSVDNERQITMAFAVGSYRLNVTVVLD